MTCERIIMNEETLRRVESNIGMMEAATIAREMAYSPYSGYSVGAAVRSAGGTHLGCNVENSAFPEGTCAEAGAIAAMVLAGHQEILEVAVIGSGDRVVVPCGGCRQKLAEFARPETKVTLSNVDASETVETTVGDLLPHAFSARWLAGH